MLNTNTDGNFQMYNIVQSKKHKGPINQYPFSFPVSKKRAIKRTQICCTINIFIGRCHGDLNLFKCCAMCAQCKALAHHWVTQRYKRTLFKHLIHALTLLFFSSHFLVSSLGLCDASYCPICSINNWVHIMQTVSFGALSFMVTDPWH